jgi:hypothetical protein
MIGPRRGSARRAALARSIGRWSPLCICTEETISDRAEMTVRRLVLVRRAISESFAFGSATMARLICHRRCWGGLSARFAHGDHREAFGCAECCRRRHDRQSLAVARGAFCRLAASTPAASSNGALQGPRRAADGRATQTVRWAWRSYEKGRYSPFSNSSGRARGGRDQALDRAERAGGAGRDSKPVKIELLPKQKKPLKSERLSEFASQGLLQAKAKQPRASKPRHRGARGRPE